MWKVEIEKKAKAELLEILKTKQITQDDIAILKKWVSELEEHGIESIQQGHFWNDYALHSEWKGYRSSSFSFKGRIIYKVVKNKVMVRIVRITTTHDYRR